MSVYREDYIIYGWKLPYDIIDSDEINKTKDTIKECSAFMSRNIDIIVDGMGGEYILFGIVLANNGKLNYANDDDDNIWQYTEIETVNKKDINLLTLLHYHLFGQNSKYKNEVKQDSPTTFIISHIV